MIMKEMIIVKIVNNNPNILFSDYDGTMSPLNLKANINAIKNFINNGNFFVISTDRSRASILKKTKMVSLTMIIYSAIQLVFVWTWAILLLANVIPQGWQWFVMYGPSLNPTWHYALIVTAMVIIMDARHHANIGRILRHEERKITWMK